MLLGWNEAMDQNSAAAGIYEAWQRHVLADERAMLVPKAAQPYIANLSVAKSLAWLEAPDGRFGAEPLQGRDTLLARALGEAVTELSGRLGPDPVKWIWGASHHALIRHPLATVSSALAAQYDVGDLPRNGDAFTVDATGGGANQTAGGSFKIIADTSDWDATIGINNPGQSGDVRSPHYKDLYPLWAAGKYFPVFYSRRKVESVTEARVELVPEAPH